MKKTIAAALLLCLCLSAFALPVSAEQPTGEPNVIYDRAGLAAIAQNPGGTYALGADIDMGGAPWAPIAFSGTLDGAGHTLYNLSIRAADSETALSVDGNHKEYDTAYAALFSRCYGATIRDVHLLGVDVRIETGGNCFAAGLVGYAEDTTITGCSVRGQVTLAMAGKMCGVAGLVGFGYGSATACAVDVTLVLVDENPDIKCEEFMGGILATGYLDIDSCLVTVRAYTSVFGYVHNGGVAGMYYVHTDDTGHKGYVNNNTVDAVIHFFEANPDRRAYCDPVVGEQLNWSMQIENNTVTNFENAETKDYSQTLLPEVCKNPVYTDVVAEGDCEHFGCTVHTCQSCGYSYADSYTAPVHQPGEWTLISEPADGKPGLRGRYCALCGRLVEQQEFVPLTACVMDHVNLELNYKDTALLEATLYPDNATERGIVFSSSNSAVASVDENGAVTALGRGTAVITAASADGSVSASCTVTVGYSFGQWLIVILLFGWLWY